jgi:DNA modification methylase
MADSIKLYRGDCLEVLKRLPAGSVDAVVTDPPYAQTNEAYDSAIACNAEVWRECFRVARPNAALVSFAGSPTYHRIASAIEAGGWRVRQMWGWIYRNGFMTSAWPREGFDRLAPALDPICFATKGKVLLTVEREGIEHWIRKRNVGEVCSWSGRSGHAAPSGTGRWPRTITAEAGIPEFAYFTLNANSPSIRGEKTGHPNQKPIPLMRWIVSKLPGRVILDPFAGSGTTLLAALEEGRQAIGIEIDPEYHAIARRRIRAASRVRESAVLEAV